VVLRDGKEYPFHGKYDDAELASMRNVAGEIMGAQAAMQYAVREGLDAITIYHDYEGIAKWALGEWKTNKAGTKAYKEFYQQISSQVKIRFVKVAGHSGDKYNDMADALAKQALGLL
jgi:ribonuclease HI